MTAGVDVQGDRLEAYLWAWGRGMRRQMVDHTVIYGDPGLPETEPGSPWAALSDYRRAEVRHVCGRSVPLLACMIDSGGHHTQAVYHYVRHHQHAGVHAVKGSSISGRAVLGKPTDQDVTWRGTKLKRGVELWPVGSDTAKAEIYGRLRITEPGPGFVLLSEHLQGDVFEQMTSERMVTRYVKGDPRLRMGQARRQAQRGARLRGLRAGRCDAGWAWSAGAMPTGPNGSAGPRCATCSMHRKRMAMRLRQSPRPPIRRHQLHLLPNPQPNPAAASVAA